MDKHTLDDLEVRGRRVLVRVDFNVPLEHTPTGSFAVADGTRIQAALPTIQALSRQGAKVILISHLGRPKGEPQPEFSLAPVATYLGNILEAPVTFVPHMVGRAAQQAVDNLSEGDVLMLENTRFHPGETRNDPVLADQWASLCDLFVNDAFGTAHRAHASNVGVASRVSCAAAGYLLQKELDVLHHLTDTPERPVVALIGGAKVSDKLGVLLNLLTRVDSLLVGGAMSYTFLKAMGKETGTSLVDDDRLEDARHILSVASGRLHLPLDHATSTRFAEAAQYQVHGETVPPDRMGLDIGPRTVAAYRQMILGARAVLWNGPMGVCEEPAFAQGTQAMATALAEATQRGATTVVGGGDSVAAIHKTSLAGQISHICTGGGAMLDFLEGKVLPGVAALTDRS